MEPVLRSPAIFTAAEPALSQRTEMGQGELPPIGLADLYRQARPNEARLRAAEAAMRAGQEQLPIAQSQLRPQVNATAARLKNQLEATEPGLFGPVTNRSQYFSENRTLSLRQPLYRPVQAAAVRAARHTVDAAVAQRDTEFAGFADRVASAWLDVQLADGQIRAAGELVRSLQLQLAAAQRALQAGTGTRTDVDEVQAQLDSAVADQVQARQFRVTALQQLEVFLAGKAVRPEPVGLERLDGLWPEPERNVDLWLDRARSRNAELRMLQAQAEAAREDIARAEAGHKPTLDLVVQRSRSASENVTRIQSSYDNTSFGLQFNLPIYSGGGVSAQARQAVAEYEKASGQYDAARAELDNRVRREHRSIVEGLARMGALRQAVLSAQTALRSAERSFEAGVRTRVDIARAAQRLALQQRELLQAGVNTLLARVRLELLSAGSDAEAETALASLEQALR
ncbi:MAG TPA: TolC family outer membrane protein [Ramlibacter sp.]|nr:TolC family outer membrane protein [Ramlibacter sp.]